MNRRTFGSSLLAAAALPRPALATGGLDVGEALESRSIRVLLASGDAFAAPQRLDAWRFGFNGRTYRGSFATISLDDGRRGLLNVVPIDAYLYGVLGTEISTGWPAAAQQAQAVAARTFVLSKLRPERAYDVVAGDTDQHYGGIEAEYVDGRDAVDATSGKILTYAGVQAHVAYSACCGGRTADAGDVWGAPYPYLISRPDPNCAAAPDFEWRGEVPFEALGRVLDLDKLGALRGVALRPPDGSGRPRALAFTGASASVDVPTRVFRSAAGGSVVRSTFLREAGLGSGGESVAVTGTGRGHGVGLCQWGAYGMAANGARVDEILAFYFPGTGFGRV
jgi:stage II sporulation protein D